MNESFSRKYNQTNCLFLFSKLRTIPDVKNYSYIVVAKIAKIPLTHSRHLLLSHEFASQVVPDPLFSRGSTTTIDPYVGPIDRRELSKSKTGGSLPDPKKRAKNRAKARGDDEDHGDHGGTQEIPGPGRGPGKSG